MNADITAAERPTTVGPQTEGVRGMIYRGTIYSGQTRAGGLMARRTHDVKYRDPIHIAGREAMAVGQVAGGQGQESEHVPAAGHSPVARQPTEAAHSAGGGPSPMVGQSPETGHSAVVAAARAVSALAHGHRPETGREHGRRPRSSSGWAKRYKIQAMITLVPPRAGVTEPGLAGPTCRAVIRAEHHETHGRKFFPALLDVRDDYVVPDAEHLVVTAVVLGEDARDYLAVGDHFALWRGRDIGQGVVTRRMFI
jgi:hypothetical protein